VRRRALGHFQSLRTDQRTQRSRDIHIGSAPLKLFLSLEHPATSQHRQNGSPSRSLVSTEPLRLLDRLSRHRNASIEDLDDIALFDRRETSFHVQILYNDSLLTFAQLPLLQVRIPPFDRVVLRPEICPSETYTLDLENYQIRTIPSSQPPSYIARLLLVITYLRQVLTTPPQEQALPQVALQQRCPRRTLMSFRGVSTQHTNLRPA
jgi:hypothetical protein